MKKQHPPPPPDSGYIVQRGSWAGVFVMLAIVILVGVIAYVAFVL